MTSAYIFLGLSLEKKRVQPQESKCSPWDDSDTVFVQEKWILDFIKYILSVEVPNPSGLFIEHSPSHCSEPCVILSEIIHEV